ncbi:YkgJ family cysteine cluster protein [Clostridium grantii]|nr:YkgJ family cysteine cluster protein [Clostridium grantii]
MYRQLDRGDGCCKYINLDTNECSIYSKRPLLCRVDEAYKVIFSTELSLEEYYRLNYEACKLLRNGVESNG